MEQGRKGCWEGGIRYEGGHCRTAGDRHDVGRRVG